MARKARKNHHRTPTLDLTREIIAELVETLRELIHHWWNDSWAPTPNQKSPVVTTPQEAYYRAHALYQRHKHLLEEEMRPMNQLIFDLLAQRWGRLKQLPSPSTTPRFGRSWTS